jgi:Glutathione S-transferase, N-terminal domain
VLPLEEQGSREQLQMALVLHGFRYSVYVRVARIVLAEKGLAYENVEVDPFAPEMRIEYLDLHPFRRVPTLVDGEFVLYETEAITRYIEASPGRGCSNGTTSPCPDGANHLGQSTPMRM